METRRDNLIYALIAARRAPVAIGELVDRGDAVRAKLRVRGHVVVVRELGPRRGLSIIREIIKTCKQ